MKQFDKTSLVNEKAYDYNFYIMSKQEKVKYILISGAILFLIGYIFLNNIFFAFFLALGAFFYPKFKARDLARQRREELNLQFKEALYSLASALSVGKSLENAFKVALQELEVLYPDRTVFIIKEFDCICKKMALNQPIEEALKDFAQRSGLEDIKNFSDVVLICKRTGGNLVQVVKSSSTIIGEKIEITQEIEMLLTKQKYEQKILFAMPVIFIGLIKFGGSGYIDSLYTSFKGYLLMSISLAILAGAYYASKEIIDIKV